MKNQCALPIPFRRNRYDQLLTPGLGYHFDISEPIGETWFRKINL